MAFLNASDANNEGENALGRSSKRKPFLVSIVDIMRDSRCSSVEWDGNENQDFHRKEGLASASMEIYALHAGGTYSMT